MFDCEPHFNEWKDRVTAGSLCSNARHPWRRNSQWGTQSFQGLATLSLLWSTSKQWGVQGCLQESGEEQERSASPYSPRRKVNSLPFWKSMCSEKHRSALRKKAPVPPYLRDILDSPLFHAACLQCDVAIFTSSIQTSCCFMLTWRMVWKSQQRHVDSRGTCLLSFLEQIKCHELQ